MQGVLSYDDLIYILFDAVKQKLILFFFDSWDGKFAENFVHSLKLAQLSEVAIGLVDHVFNKVILRWQHFSVLLFHHSFLSKTAQNKWIMKKIINNQWPY